MRQGLLKTIGAEGHPRKTSKENLKTKKESKMKTISDQKIVDKTPLDLQVKSLETSMCTLIKAFKELRSIVKILEDKVNQPENKEIQNIMESQKILDIAMKENSDAIEKINSEIRDLQNDKSKENVHQEDNRKTEKGAKICKYYNRGHCKYKMECRFRHSNQICKTHLEGGKCDKNVCQDRNPKVCKGWQGKSGCSRIGCDYLHGTLASDDGQKLTKVFHVLAARTATTTRDLLCIIMSII